jgi:hypothetical protein
LVEQEATAAPTETCSPVYLKYELLVAYGNYQKHYSALDGDPEWPSLVQNGTLQQAIHKAFPVVDSDAGVYRQTLETLIYTWQ